MTTCIRFLFIVTLLLSLSSYADATSNEPIRLTLPQAVELALSDNPDLALSRQRLQSAEVSVAAANGQFLPSLQGSASAKESFRQQTSPGVPDESHSSDLQLTASLNLFNGFADRSKLDASRQQLQAADASLQRQQQIVTFSVVSRYTAVLINRELVQVAEQNLESQHDLQQQIEAFYQAGTRPVTDHYQQQAAAAQAEFSLVDARRNLQVAKLELLQTLGITLPGTLDVLPVEGQALVAELGDPDPLQSLEQALTSRPDLIAQQFQMTAARQQTRVARAGYLPSLDLQASVGTSYSSASDDGGFADQLDDNRGASLGLALSIPIFDRDQTRTSVAQARIGEADARTNLLKLKQQVGFDVGQAIADYRRARLQLNATGLQLAYAGQALAASEERYRVGATTWIELSTAQSVFVKAQGDQIRARYEVLRQGLNIGYTRGDLATLLNLLTVQESSL